MIDRFKFNELRAKIERVKRIIPTVLANNAQNFFVATFDKQAWEGKKWEEVKRRIPGTVEYKYPSNKDLGRRTRPILIGKGSTKLRRAVNNSVRVKIWPRVLLLVDLPYAKAHNEGNENLPQRKFMGTSSKTLHKIQLNSIKQHMDDLKN